MPIEVTGSNSSPNWNSIKGFDATSGALQSIYLQHNLGLGTNGELRRSDVSEVIFFRRLSLTSRD